MSAAMQMVPGASCVQKIGNVFRVDRQALAELPGLGMLPLGQGVANEMIPRAELEGYLKPPFLRPEHSTFTPR